LEDVVLDWVSRSPDIPAEVKPQLAKICRQEHIKGSVLAVVNDKMQQVCCTYSDADLPKTVVINQHTSVVFGKWIAFDKCKTTSV